VDIDSWVNFIAENGSANGSMSSFISGQHSKSIEAKIKDIKEFRRFIENVKEKVPAFVAASARGKHAGDRDEAVAVFAKIMQDAALGTACNPTASQIKNFGFMSHQILADTESFYDLPWGKISAKSIRPGIGGRSGLSILRFMESIEHDRTWISRLKQAFREMLALLKTFNSEQLNMLGLTWHGDRIVSKRNGRAFSYTDVEHYCCKLSIGCYNTHATRTVSENPKADLPHTHPFTKKSRDLVMDAQVEAIFADARQGFHYTMTDQCKKLTDNGIAPTFTLPEVFRFNEEPREFITPETAANLMSTLAELNGKALTETWASEHKLLEENPDEIVGADDMTGLGASRLPLKRPRTTRTKKQANVTVKRGRPRKQEEHVNKKQRKTITASAVTTRIQPKRQTKVQVASAEGAATALYSEDSETSEDSEDAKDSDSSFLNELDEYI
jgi:hypothetical protein